MHKTHTYQDMLLSCPTCTFCIYSSYKKNIFLPTFQHLAGLGRDWGINKI